MNGARLIFHLAFFLSGKFCDISGLFQGICLSRFEAELLRLFFIVTSRTRGVNLVKKCLQSSIEGFKGSLRGLPSSLLPHSVITSLLKHVQLVRVNHLLNLTAFRQCTRSPLDSNFQFFFHPLKLLIQSFLIIEFSIAALAQPHTHSSRETLEKITSL